MPVVVGVVLKKAGKMYYFDPGGLRPDADTKVIVETARGVEIGDVVAAAKDLEPGEVIMPLKKVVRIAAPEDIRKDEANKDKERDAYKIGQDKIRQHGLPMKLVETESLFDGSKLIFYFTAEGRVDFRELVKDLAATFKTRIELRQIGVRDEAKSIGGLGPCGRDLCCRTFLADFEPVSIKMAKEQNLPLNPIKISGVCSRLMCCLKYENDVYIDFKKRAPRMGAEVATDEGEGRVVGFCAPRDAVVVELPDSQRQIQVPLDELKKPGRRREVKETKPRPKAKETKATETKPRTRTLKQAAK
ncbi:MAG: stage 0 sporulation family protein [Actinomycetota bacterium]